jgi:hypothetical protein
MSIWVMFISGLPLNTNSGVAVTTQESTSGKACEDARLQIEELVVRNNFVGSRPTIISFCTPKRDRDPP